MKKIVLFIYFTLSFSLLAKSDKTIPISPINDYNLIYSINQKCELAAMDNIVQQLSKNLPQILVAKADIDREDSDVRINIYFAGPAFNLYDDIRLYDLTSFRFAAAKGLVAYLNFNEKFVYNEKQEVIANEDVTLVTLESITAEDFQLKSKDLFIINGHDEPISINVPMKLWNECLRVEAEKL